jgi:hypothetical protein
LYGDEECGIETYGNGVCGEADYSEYEGKVFTAKIFRNESAKIRFTFPAVTGQPRLLGAVWFACSRQGFVVAEVHCCSA